MFYLLDTVLCTRNKYICKQDRHGPCPLGAYRPLGEADSIKVRSVRKEKNGASRDSIKRELTNSASKSRTVTLKPEKMNRSS